MSTTPTELRLADSNGRLIKFGDIIKRKTDNPERHGEHSYSRVLSRRGVPITSYLLSDAGYILPPDYVGGPLSENYDIKRLLWAPDDEVVRPMADDLFVVSEAELPHPVLTREQWRARAADRRLREAIARINPRPARRAKDNTDGD